MLAKGFRYNASVIFLCLLWYLLSAGGNVLNKLILQEFPFPLTLATSSIVTTSISSIPLGKRVVVAERKHHAVLSVRRFFTMIIPLALGKLIAVSMSFFSLYKVPVSYAHTVKAMMPLFSVICARLIVGEKQTKMVYLSLIPIVTGVVIASCSEMSFNFLGLLSALCSTFSYALINSYVKKVMRDTGLHHVHLLGRIAQTTCFLIFPLWFFHDVLNFNKVEVKLSWITLFGGVVLSGFLNFAQNVCTFSLISRLSVLSYAVANVTKRITVISVSLLTLKNPVSLINICGMLTAVFGVLGYTQVSSSFVFPLCERLSVLELRSQGALVLFRGSEGTFFVLGMTDLLFSKKAYESILLNSKGDQGFNLVWITAVVLLLVAGGVVGIVLTFGVGRYLLSQTGKYKK